MRVSQEAEQFRSHHQAYGFKTNPGDLFGWFEVPKNHHMGPLYIMACAASHSRAGDWDHVSVSIPNAKGAYHTPSWSQMCWVKSLFWDEEDTVLQFHPKASEYKNVHPGCLHLWKKGGQEHELPPSIMVAP